MKIAISGADGFLGTRILERLSKDMTHEVVAITLFPDKLSEQFPEYRDLSIVSADLKKIEASRELDDVDVYLACAFPRQEAGAGFAEGLDFVYGSLSRLLDKGCKAVINVSSQSVYDPHRTAPAKETDSVVLTSEYAVAKYCVELSVARMCQDKGVPYTNVRMASLIGPGFDQRFVNKMVRSAIEAGEIDVVDNGSVFGFLDVRDAAEELVLLCQLTNRKLPPLLNLGPDRSSTLLEIATMVHEELTIRGVQSMVVTAENKCTNEEKTSSAINATLLRGILGWGSGRSLQSSVADIVCHALSNSLQADDNVQRG